MNNIKIVISKIITFLEDIINNIIPTLEGIMSDLCFIYDDLFNLNKNKDKKILIINPKEEQTSRVLNVEPLSVDDSKNYNTLSYKDFFSIDKNKDEFFLDLSLLISKNEIPTKLVYYMFCCDKKYPNSKLDNEMKSFLSNKNFVYNFGLFVNKYEFLSNIFNSNIPNHEFTKYLFLSLFSNETSYSKNIYKYNRYFFELLRTTI